MEDDSTHRTFDIEKYGENKNIDYTYDRAGNITKIKTDGKLTNAYEYDAHGRLTWEYDYDVSRAYEYGYTTTGNVEAKHTYVINANGSLVEQDDELRKYSYRNSDWPDQLTKYCGKEMTAVAIRRNTITECHLTGTGEDSCRKQLLPMETG